MGTTGKMILTRIIRPLKSRKVRAAFATVVGAYLADAGLEVSDGVLFGIVTVGVGYILGVAIEDHGAKSQMRGELLEVLTAEAPVGNGVPLGGGAEPEHRVAFNVPASE